MFVISRYVLPLVERRDRGATARSRWAACSKRCRPTSWRVIHDASLGHGNVDHILIGPPGVFTIETKSHPGPVRVGRVHGATLSQAQAQRDAIERVTGMSVEPLIVFSRAWVDRPLARRKGVRVLPGADARPDTCAGRCRACRARRRESASERLAEALRDHARVERLARTHRLRAR